MNVSNAEPIRRYAIIVDEHGRGPRIRSCRRTRHDAVAEAARVRSFQKHSCGPSPARVTVDKLEVQPNKQVLQFGVERFDRMLTDVGHHHITLTGSLDELIECGAIGSYIREILGKSGSKSSCDEYGNHYRLSKRGKHRHELTLYFSEEPQIPDGNALRPIGFEIRDPDEIDISGILARITAKGDAS